MPRDIRSWQAGIKAWQKRAQFALLSAERWAAITAVRGDVDYPRDQLETAWKQVLFNQFHDVLPGSAIEPSYDDARDQLGEAVAIAKRILVRAHNVLTNDRIYNLADLVDKSLVELLRIPNCGRLTATRLAAAQDVIREIKEGKEEPAWEPTILKLAPEFTAISIWS